MKSIGLLGRLVLCVATLQPAVLLAVENERAVGFATALHSITRGELQDEIKLLADDRFEGRESGKPGGYAAAEELVAQLAALQLAPGGEGGSYYQPLGDGYRNIIGVLPGSDPQLAKQYVIVSAHYDHVGRGWKRASRGTIGAIHNGADDNASGTAAVIEVAEAFTFLPERPRRSILFILWDAEERGLVGSKHWAAAPTVPIRHVTAMLNADMIGQVRDNRLVVYGSRTAADLRQRISRANDESALDLDFKWKLIANSDHYPVAEREVPVVLFHSGLTEQYHTEHDDPETLDFDGVRRTARLMFALAWSLADDNSAGAFRTKSFEEDAKTRRAIEKRWKQPPRRLGVQWEHDDLAAESEGIRVARVEKNRAGALADIRRGDRILRIDGHSVSLATQNEFILAVMTAERTIELDVLREGYTEPIRRAVVLGGVAAPLGMRLRKDDAEPGALIVAFVLPESPAAGAGIEVGDRIYSVDGRPCTTIDDFRRRTYSQEGWIDLETERRGRIRHVQIETGRFAT